MMDESGSDAKQPTLKRSRRWIRFGLLELLLLTGVIAAWLSATNAKRKIPGLRQEIQQMRFATSQLIIQDQSKLNIRSLPTVWHNINSWKYSAPPNADLELRLATEGINSIALPADYQAVPLPEGEHSIHMKATRGSYGYRTLVYIDDDLVLQQDHEPGWLKSQGSSSTGDLSSTSAAYDPGKSWALKLQKYCIRHPLAKNRSIEIPEDYDQKGNGLWISPRSVVPKPTPRFVTKDTESQDSVGHRQGMRVLLQNFKGFHGLIGVQPSLQATFGEDRRWNRYCPIGISVRPVTSEGAVAETPELADSQSQKWGHRISLTDSIDPPTSPGRRDSKNLVSEQAISQDNQSLRAFAHFDAFASGAKPIVEVLFDAEHPNRIGLLPHAAPGSTPMQAIRFVTRYDAKFMWREIELADDSNDTQISNVPLTKLDQILGIKKSKDSDWKRIPLSKLPRVTVNGSAESVTVLSAVTDVPDTTKITFPVGLQREWKYEGVANRQVWLLPDSDPEISIDLRSSKVYPTTKSPIPGGPAIQNVRITVPMPAKKPIWFKIVAEENQP